MLLAYGLRRTKLQRGLPARLGGRHAGAQVFLRLQRDVFGDLFLQTFIGTPPSREVRQSHEEATKKFHARSSALTSKKRAMIAAV